jgi:hypothetical protein
MSNEKLQMQYDALSKTVLVQLGDKSHVLDDQFEDKISAEAAGVQYAESHWHYVASRDARR